MSFFLSSCQDIFQVFKCFYVILLMCSITQTALNRTTKDL